MTVKSSVYPIQIVTIFFDRLQIGEIILSSPNLRGYCSTNLPSLRRVCFYVQFLVILYLIWTSEKDLSKAPIKLISFWTYNLCVLFQNEGNESKVQKRNVWSSPRLQRQFDSGRIAIRVCVQPIKSLQRCLEFGSLHSGSSRHLHLRPDLQRLERRACRHARRIDRHPDFRNSVSVGRNLLARIRPWRIWSCFLQTIVWVR